jgi:hypothetical protein
MHHYSYFIKYYLFCKRKKGKKEKRKKGKKEKRKKGKYYSLNVLNYRKLA